MILRKPYAFLIKNFKKIHIALLVLGLFVAFKLVDVSGYVKEFIRLGTYDFFGDPITKHISFLLNLSLLLIIAGSVALLLLLRYKQKPWKIYLIPIVEYAVLFLVLGMIKSFFNGYSSKVDATDIRLTRDLLMIFAFGQIPALGVFIIRVFGLDMKKFQFNFDEEFLQLSEEDREEFEIGLNFDKYTIIRWVKRFIRNVKYVYLEHKLVFYVIGGVVLFIFTVSTARYIFITNKSYSEGERYNINGYTFQVNNAYYTDKDYNGNIISKTSAFVIVDLTITNHNAARTVNLDYFHVKNGVSDYTTTKRTYAKEFHDLGTAYESTRKINKDESLNLIIIYKVDKNLKKNRFVLFYQEKSGALRKIKLKTKNVSHIADVKKLKVGDEIPLSFRNKEDNLRIDYVSLDDSVNFVYKDCRGTKCFFATQEKYAPEGFKILSLQFYSEVYEAKNIIDFLRNYGKLNYRDSEDEENVIDIENAITEEYSGKTAYLKVPVELETSTDVYIDFIIRDKHYAYDLQLGGNDNEED